MVYDSVWCMVYDSASCMVDSVLDSTERMYSVLDSTERMYDSVWSSGQRNTA
jgi:hypothetical protein